MNRKVDKNKKKMRRSDKQRNNANFPKQVSSNWFSFLKSQENHGKWKIIHSHHDNETKCTNRIKSNEQPAVTKVLSLDCEMVSTLDNEDMLGRVSVVNYKLQCVYDKFVKPTSPIGDYRTRYSGIRANDLEKGFEFAAVQKEVRELLRNKILVGHALENDFKVLKFRHVKNLIRDTAKYELFRTVSDGQSPALKKLAKIFLSEKIQTGEHNSVEDAKTAMKLYIKYRHEWESSILKMRTQQMV